MNDYYSLEEELSDLRILVSVYEDQIRSLLDIAYIAKGIAMSGWIDDRQAKTDLEAALEQWDCLDGRFWRVL